MLFFPHRQELEGSASMNTEIITDNLAAGVGDSVPSTTSCSHFIFKAYKYRICPNAEQRVLLAKHFGCCRFVYNRFLEQRNKTYKEKKEIVGYVKMAAMMARLKTEGKYSWLGETYSHALQAELKHLDIAFKRFYGALKDGNAKPVMKNGKPTGRLLYEPRFKSKKDTEQSVTFPDNVKVVDSKLVLPKFKGGIRMKMHRPLGGRICHATVSKDCRGKYHVSILCEEECEYLPKADKSIGIDLGVKEIAVCSNGERVENPKFLERSEKHTKYLQRQVSRKKKGSNRRRKARLSLSRQHEKTRNRRTNHIHKFTNRIVSENQAICVEDLNVKGMMANHHLAKSIWSVSFSEIVRQLEYKSRWYGRDFVKIPRFYPSSKRCNHCGYVYSGLTLKDREWECPNCHKEVDRDYNASLNIEEKGLEMLSGMGAMSDVKQKGGEAAA